MQLSILFLYLITLFVIGFLVYLLLNRPQKVMIYNEMPPATIPTHWWGYGWRPWWRKYNGLPGLGKSLPKPKMPKPPKSTTV